MQKWNKLSSRPWGGSCICITFRRNASARCALCRDESFPNLHIAPFIPCIFHSPDSAVLNLAESECVERWRALARFIYGCRISRIRSRYAHAESGIATPNCVMQKWNKLSSRPWGGSCICTTVRRNASARCALCRDESFPNLHIAPFMPCIVHSPDSAVLNLAESECF